MVTIHPKHTHASFTLVELLIGISIIVILAGMTVGGARYASYAGKASRAKAEIKAMELALENFKSDHGEYPPSEDDAWTSVPTGKGATELYQLYSNSFTVKVYMELKNSQIGKADDKSFIKDPWGQPYGYNTSTNSDANPCAPGPAIWTTAGNPSNTNKWISNWAD